MSCSYCRKQAVYRCNVCGKLLCPQHAKLTTICPTHQNKPTTPLHYKITQVKTEQDKHQIQQFVQRFWGEQQQLTFNKTYTVTQLPTYTAKTNNTTIAFIAYTNTDNATLIVALAILPPYQNQGIAKALIKKLETHAKKQHKHALLVSTSNDDLPALAFYQQIGFQITQVKPNIITQKHGKTIKGINGLPVRDEIRLRKTLH
jgi:ribosomal protein S18 acetylase RimI-like enzyme